jgi:hypothetical protein
MEQVNNIELSDESIFPDDKILEGILGESYNSYCDLKNLFDKNGLSYEWKYYKDGKAWLCKVTKSKRTIVWMSAWKGFMKATIYFPERLTEGIFGLEISMETKNKIRNTKNVGKSEPCMFEIRNRVVINEFEKVMEFKIISK